jgi:hypothetical protein
MRPLALVVFCLCALGLILSSSTQARDLIGKQSLRTIGASLFVLLALACVAMVFLIPILG